MISLCSECCIANTGLYARAAPALQLNAQALQQALQLVRAGEMQRQLAAALAVGLHVGHHAQRIGQRPLPGGSRHARRLFGRGSNGVFQARHPALDSRTDKPPVSISCASSRCAPRARATARARMAHFDEACVTLSCTGCDK